ncbi:MAG: phage tail tape measure protein, partial [Clostridiales Family XIII bacterium]|nr:phage tail tape measure protein [Clostridiales Family XIII bacterium]
TLDEYKEKYGETSAEVEKQTTVLGKEETELSKVQTALNKATAETNKFKDELEKTDAEMRDMKFAETQKKLDNLATGLNDAAKKLAPFSLAAGGVLAASAAVFVGFDDSMRQVKATMNLTGTEGAASFDKLSEAAQKMGRETRYTAANAAEALNVLALAGYDTDKAISTLPKTLSLAAAGTLDMQRAAELTTDGLNALGLSTDSLDEYVDKMARTSQKSATDIAQLGEATLTAAGQARLAKMPLTDMNTALGLLANAGIKGSEAGGMLQRVLMNLMDQTGPGAVKMKELGVSAFDAQGNMRPLQDILKDLNASMDGMSDRAKSATFDQVFNVRSVKGASALLSGAGEAWDSLAAEIDNAEGAAAQMAATMEEGVGGSLRTMRSALEGAGITFGNTLSPMIEKAAKSVVKITEAFQKLSPKQQETIVKTTLAVAAAAPALKLAGAAVTAIKSVTATIHIMRTAQTASAAASAASAAGLGTMSKAVLALNAAIKANPLGLMVGVLAAATAGIIALSVSMDKAAKDADPLWQETQDLAEKAKELTESVKENKGAYDEAAAAAETQAGVASKLKDEIADLSEKENKSAAEKEVLAQKVSALNDLLPGLGLAYDSVTDSLNLTNSEIDKHIENMKREAEAAAVSAAWNKNAEAALQVEMELKRARDDQAEASAKLAEAEEKLAEAKSKSSSSFATGADISKYSQEISLAKKEVEAASEAEETLTKTSEDLAKEADFLTQKMNDNAAAMAQSKEATEAGAMAVMSAAEIQAEYSALLQENAMLENRLTEATKTQEQATKDMEAAKAALNTAMADNNGSDAAKQKIDELSLAYTGTQIASDNANAAVEGLQGQLGSSSETIEIARAALAAATAEQNALGESAASASGQVQGASVTMGAALGCVSDAAGAAADSVAGSMNNTVTIIDGAVPKASESGQKLGKGVTDASAKEIAEGSSKITDAATQTVQKAATGTQVAAQASGKSVGDKFVTGEKTAINTGAPQVAAAAQDTLNGLGNLANTSYSQGENIGAQLMAGAAKGIAENSYQFSDAAGDAAQAAYKAAAAKLKISSPSKAFEYLGEMTADGFSGGILGGVSDVVRAVTSMSDAAMGAVDVPASESVRVGIGSMAQQNNNAGFDAMADRIADRIVKGLGQAKVVMSSHEFDRIVIGALKTL